MTVPRSEDVQHIDVPSLREWLRDQERAMLADVADYVSTETPSTDKEALRQGFAWLRQWLEQRLGPPAGSRVVDGVDYGDMLVADYPGQGPGTVALLCHYDTVWELGTLTTWPFESDGDRASGPGVFDMKAGLVQVVWALRALDALGLPRPPVRLILNGDEEIGSPVSRPVLEEACEGTAAVLVFEASANGAVKTARKGVGIFRAELSGVEAHAGLDFTNGASAIAELARLVLDLHALTDLDSGTTVNVGAVHGGSRTNVVAGHAVADIDVRAQTVKDAQQVEESIKALRPHDPRVALALTGGWNRPVMERTDGVAEMYELARTLATQIGIELREASVGGGSDGSFVAANGLPVLDGLGAVGGGAHARHEHISISGMIERAALAAGVLQALSSRSD